MPATANRGADRLVVRADCAEGPNPEPAVGLLTARPGQPRAAYAAGEIVQRDVWFPPVSVPVTSRHVRRAAQLPVVTMVTGTRGGCRRG
jgi:hypothetical protein